MSHGGVDGPYGGRRMRAEAEAYAHTTTERVLHDEQLLHDSGMRPGPSRRAVRVAVAVVALAVLAVVVLASL